MASAEISTSPSKLFLRGPFYFIYLCTYKGISAVPDSKLGHFGFTSALNNMDTIESCANKIIVFYF